MKKKWIIVWRNGISIEPMWFESTEKSKKDKPVLFKSKIQAVSEMIKDHIDTLSMQLDQIREGHRDPDDADLDYDGWVAECTVDKKGCITVEGEIIYNPKTFKR